MIPIVSSFEAKQKLFDIAKENYTRVTRSKPEVGLYPNPYLVRFRATHMHLGATNQKPIVSYHAALYDYVETDASPLFRTAWVSFANKQLGGGYLGRGYVQEEILTLEFYEMAQLIFGSRNSAMDIDEAFVFKNLLRTSISDPRYYGKLNQAVLHYPEKIEVANFLAIDAPRRQRVDEPYTEEELMHLATKSYVGFSACVSIGMDIINTGNWGAGVFYNRRDVVYYIQLLSAWLAGVSKIGFWKHEDKGVHKVMEAFASSETVEEFIRQGPRVLSIDASFIDIYG